MAQDQVASVVARLQASGSRVTAPRRRVIEAVVSNPDHHMTAAEIVATVRDADPDFYESTVYRTLDRLVELGVLDRVQLGPGAAVFHLAHRPHEHLVCELCGEVTHVDADLLDGLARLARSRHGFELHRSASTLVGRCERCAAAPA